MAVPGEGARRAVDILREAEWRVQSYADRELAADGGIALIDLPGAMGDDLLLLCVDGRSLGVAYESARQRYAETLVHEHPDDLDVEPWTRPLPFEYQLLGDELTYVDRRDPDARPRHVSHVHLPETLLARHGSPLSRRRRFQSLSSCTAEGEFESGAGEEPLRSIEDALAQNRQRFAVPAGATPQERDALALALVLRLVRCGDSHRLLVLLDDTERRRRLRDALVHAWRAMGLAHRVDVLELPGIDMEAKVVISSREQIADLLGTPPSYLSSCPIETFDVVVLCDLAEAGVSDFAGREYFDAFVIGLAPAGTRVA